MTIAADPFVIADARRRAVRRRRRRWLVGVAAAVATAGAVSHLRADGPAPGAAPRAGNGLHNGPIAVLAAPVGTRGWYGVSRVGIDGRLHPFLRCPAHASWCGEAESIAWDRSGDQLAIAVTSFGMPNPSNGLHVVDVRTGRDTRIRSCNVPPGECDWFDLAWAPDGRSIAYVSSGNVVLVDRDGGHRRVIRPVRGRLSSPTWSPHGHTLAFADETGRSSSVYRVDLDGRNLSLLADHATSPAWSPTGTIAYHSDCGIRLMTGAGTPIVPAAARPCGAVGPPHLATPVWSPDGTRIAGTLSRRRPDATRGTYVMKADGTDAHRLTTATLSVFVGGRPRVAWQPVP